ncbi:hypothetical protein [Prescottella agglutinans]|uniref:Knr4/Smi1-like domain-containing protein n=1 Tax=Prescottella agglutinans TaxID=1644129 RepID=A0ABT6M6C2_9NOCA|nr:hypothetical protein [Prescottella agglutinans]MDH6279434.1 hypothetical protein [Prescottella agglutinans]
MSTDGVRISDGTMKWLEDFLVDWYGARSPGYGSPDADLPASLPSALRELYAFAGRWPSRDPEEHLPDSPMILQQQDVLVRAADLSTNGAAIDFLCENQDSWTCRVAASTDASAVFSNAHWMWDDVDMDDYVELAPTLEHFLTSFVLQETVMGCRNLVVAEDATALGASGLTDRATPLWLQGWYVFDEPTHSFWRSGPFLLAEIAGTHWVGWNDDAAGLPAAASEWRRVRNDGV